MTTNNEPPGSVDGLLCVNCTCEQSIVLATPRQVRDGTPLSCGRPHCEGTVGGRVNGRHVAAGGVTRPGHGTEARAKRHIRDGEPPCPACRHAATQAVNRRRRR